MPIKNLIPFVIALGATAIIMTACKNVSSDSFCHLYRPVYSSPQDTQQTRDEANANNAVWLERCKK
jgi:hypothetical protein